MSPAPGHTGSTSHPVPSYPHALLPLGFLQRSRTDSEHSKQSPETARESKVRGQGDLQRRLGLSRSARDAACLRSVRTVVRNRPVPVPVSITCLMPDLGAFVHGGLSHSSLSARSSTGNVSETASRDCNSRPLCCKEPVGLSCHSSYHRPRRFRNAFASF